MNGNQVSDRTEAQDGKEPRGTPLYRDPAKLRAAYEAGGFTIRGAARELDEAYSTVRRWLIEFGIHQPRAREDDSLAKKLELANPDEVAPVDVETEARV